MWSLHWTENPEELTGSSLRLLIGRSWVRIPPGSQNISVIGVNGLASSVPTRRVRVRVLGDALTYTGIVKWYHTGLQNRCSEFESWYPCKYRRRVN